MRVMLHGCFAGPIKSLPRVLLYSATFEIKRAKINLSGCMAAFGRFAQPVEALRLVPGHASAIQVLKAEQILRLCILRDGSALIPPGCLRFIMRKSGSI